MNPLIENILYSIFCEYKQVSTPVKASVHTRFILHEYVHIGIFQQVTDY